MSRDQERWGLPKWMWRVLLAGSIIKNVWGRWAWWRVLCGNGNSFSVQPGRGRRAPEYHCLHREADKSENWITPSEYQRVASQEAIALFLLEKSPSLPLLLHSWEFRIGIKWKERKAWDRALNGTEPEITILNLHKKSLDWIKKLQKRMILVILLRSRNWNSLAKFFFKKFPFAYMGGVNCISCGSIQLYL